MYMCTFIIGNKNIPYRAYCYMHFTKSTVLRNQYYLSCKMKFDCNFTKSV